MKKKVLALVVAVLALGSTSVFAQSQSQSCPPQQKECCKDKKDKKDRKDKKDKKGNKKHGNPFEGIQLTPEQQQQIDNLRAEQKAQKKANREAGKELSKEARKEAKTKARQEFDAKVQKILTPEQYAQFKKNCEAQKAKKEMKKKDKKERAGKKDKGASKGKERAQLKDSTVK